MLQYSIHFVPDTPSAATSSSSPYTDNCTMTVSFSFDAVIEDNGLQLVATDADGMPQLPEEEQFQSTFQDTSLVAGGNDLGLGSIHTSTRCAQPSQYVYSGICIVQLLASVL